MARGIHHATLRKIFIMARKNLLLRKYHYFTSAFEIIVPTLLFVILVVIGNSMSGVHKDQKQDGSDNRVPASIPSRLLYPTDFCKSLEEILDEDKRMNFVSKRSRNLSLIHI